MFKYETHLHTYPVSKCASASVRDTMLFYKKKGYDGVFVTNHFLDGYINVDPNLPYEDRINFYFSDYEEGVKIGEEIGLKVFVGIESSYMGVDFLVYGLDKQWYLDNPQIMTMKKNDQLGFFMQNGALVIHAHPFRYDSHNDYIRLMPKSVHGVEVINACRSDDVNEMARLYAEHYGLLKFAGSDNHAAEHIARLAGMTCERPINSETDFVKAVLGGEMDIFLENN